jgi:predicted DsbA family dithiol-disulfide isomerase
MTISTPQQPTAEPSTDRQLQIDVWSDLACPWCYVGKHRLDQAIAASPHAAAITVRVHSYELDPDMSHEATPNLDVVAAKYGLTPAQAQHMEDKVIAIAHRDGQQLRRASSPAPRGHLRTRRPAARSSPARTVQRQGQRL